jgi:hypothetical protein
MIRVLVVESHMTGIKTAPRVLPLQHTTGSEGSPGKAFTSLH